MKILTMNHLVHGLAAFFSSKKQGSKSVSDYKQEALVRLGRIQFEKLLQKGLSIPVAVL